MRFAPTSKSAQSIAVSSRLTVSLSAPLQTTLTPRTLGGFTSSMLVPLYELCAPRSKVMKTLHFPTPSTDEQVAATLSSSIALYSSNDILSALSSLLLGIKESNISTAPTEIMSTALQFSFNFVKAVERKLPNFYIYLTFSESL